MGEVLCTTPGNHRSHKQLIDWCSRADSAWNALNESTSCNSSSRSKTTNPIDDTDYVKRTETTTIQSRNLNNLSVFFYNQPLLISIMQGAKPNRFRYIAHSCKSFSQQEIKNDLFPFEMSWMSGDVNISAQMWKRKVSCFVLFFGFVL